MANLASEFQLPGFRFHPTEEELLTFYLKNMIFGNKPRVDIIGFLNIYRHDPWDLPGLARIGEREWYFFVPRDRKHGNGGRPNRTTAKGFWKATGSDRKIFSLSDPKRIIGLRKTLVFYEGRAPSGSKTDWVMNEYRLPNPTASPNDIVLCKIYRKATPLKVLEQRATMEESKTIQVSPVSSMSVLTSLDNTAMSSFCYQEEDPMTPISPHSLVLKKEMEDTDLPKDTNICNRQKVEDVKTTTLRMPLDKKKLPELEVPKLSMDWNNQDSFWLSPWLQNLTPIANILNF